MSVSCTFNKPDFKLATPESLSVSTSIGSEFERFPFELTEDESDNDPRDLCEYCNDILSTNPPCCGYRPSPYKNLIVIQYQLTADDDLNIGPLREQYIIHALHRVPVPLRDQINNLDELLRYIRNCPLVRNFRFIDGDGLPVTIFDDLKVDPAEHFGFFPDCLERLHVHKVNVFNLPPPPPATPEPAEPEEESLLQRIWARVKSWCL